MSDGRIYLPSLSRSHEQVKELASAHQNLFEEAVMHNNMDVEVVLVGDVYVQRPDPDSAFAYAGDCLRAADIAFGNLETVVADMERLPFHGRRKGPRTDEWMLEAYVRAGFNVVNLANNPSMYQGVEGLLRTIEVLD